MNNNVEINQALLPALYHNIAYQDVESVFALFADQPFSCLLESAKQDDDNGRYSFIGVWPFHTLQASTNDGCPFAKLSTQLSKFKLPTDTRAPFQGGAMGLFSYELAHALEQLPRLPVSKMQFPDLAIGFYDLVFAFDHCKKKAWIISNGFPETARDKQKQRQRERLAELLAFYNNAPVCDYPRISVSLSAIEANFTKDHYREVCQRAIDYIYAGDIFEVNLAQTFYFPLPDASSYYGLYQQLRAVNPAPFAAYFNIGDSIVCSASPERFVRCKKRYVDVRPIKGTRPRSPDPIRDAELAQALQHSEKDIAENVMIVDLMRNDLAKVCKDESIIVTQCCGLESFATVHHLVSTVQAELLPEHDAVSLLKACFPGGSITGAPKIRAMEIISELEQTPRGPYCGSMAYISFDGNMDSSILIRTFSLSTTMQVAAVQGGGAIVADSESLQEYQETLDKVAGLKRAVVG